MSRTVKALEAEFEAAVVDLAHMFGWSVMAVRPAIRGNKGDWSTPWKYDGEGWPDLTLVNPERQAIIFAELKMPPNKVTDRQAEWLDRLARVDCPDGDAVIDRTEPGKEAWSELITVGVWTPDDADHIAWLLSNGKVTEWRP